MAGLQLMPNLSWTHIHFVRNVIKFMRPPFSRKQYGWLFPDGDQIKRRVWVGVPVILGRTRAFHLEELETDIWMDGGRGGNGPTSDITRNSILVDRFPFDEPCPLEYAFYILVADQRTTGPDVHPVNELVTSWIPELAVPWRGNVLVFKRGKGKGNPIISINDRDSTFVEAIIKRVIRDGSVGKQRAVFPVVTLTMRYLTRAKTAALTPVKPSSPERVWSIDELHKLILNSMSLATLVHYRTISKVQRAEVTALFWNRVFLYTSPFFQDSKAHTVFMDLLQTLNSLIVGSVPLAVLSVSSNADCPDNLNVIASYLTYARWYHAMLYTFHFSVEFEGNCEGPYEVVGYRFIRFSNPSVPGKYITITFSNQPDIFELWFSAPNTLQWNAIAGHTLICPNIEATSDLEAVRGWWIRNKAHSMFRAPIPNLPIASPFPNIVNLDGDTDQWTKPCGWLCPGTWRLARGLQGIGHWAWGGMSKNDITEERVLWALNRISTCLSIVKCRAFIMSLAPLLSELSFPEDLHLGPGRQYDSSAIEHLYVYNNLNPVQVVVYGVIHDIVCHSTGDHTTTLLILRAPRCFETRQSFKTQAEMLEKISRCPRNKPSRLLLDQQYWSQGPSTDAYVFVRITERTEKIKVNIATEPIPDAYKFLRNDTPHVFRKCDFLEPGALVVCMVYMFMADFKVSASSTVHERVSKFKARLQ
ncbi:hypothetical protein B0H13DRAFT_1901964 [Mycena leptocephala]|nr:hypothetical protein B0H13DRAFT_1901964 [Mycena leptocephala]